MTNASKPYELDDAVSNAAWLGWSALMARTSVALSWQKKDEQDRVHVGSGVALRTGTGVPFVLTAAHVAEGSFAHPSKILLQNERRVDYTLCDAWAKCHVDESVDVAIIVPPHGGELWAALLQASESVDMVEPSYERTHRDGDVYMVFGYPADIVKVDTDRREVRFRTFQWLCDPREPPVKRCDDDMLEFKWIETGAPLFDMKNPGVVAGRAPNQASGMSGGPLWRHRDTIDPATKMWTPQVACRIVGLQRDYRASSRDVYLDPSERWYDWLMRRIAALDAGWTK